MFLTISSDASFNDGFAGIACVMKTAAGEVIESVTKKQRARDIFVAELKGLLEAAKIAQRYSDGNEVVIVSDNQTAVKFINDEAVPPHSYSALVKEIKAHTNNCKVIWRARTDNSQADALASLAYRRAGAAGSILTGGLFSFNL